MIKTLVQKGWNKNEVVYEMQRVFGNDVLILPENLKNDGSLLLASVIPLSVFGFTLGFIALRRRRIGKLASASQHPLHDKTSAT